MAELVQDNWILLVIALIVAVLVAWWIFAATRRTKVEIERQDEAEPTSARRNQALIDAPPAAATGTTPPATPIGMAGVGEAVVAATITAPPVPEPEPFAIAPSPIDPSPLNPPHAQPESAEPEPDTAESAAAEPNAAEPAPADPAPQATSQPTPAPAAAPATSPASAGGEELTRIKGLGPKLADQLRTLGITSLAQIAAWDDAEIDRVDAQLGRFQGRIRRDNWPEQARLLTSGDVSAYEARFGKL